MDLELAGKVAVVTGASKGIGLAVVRSWRRRARWSSPAPTVDACDGIDGSPPLAVDLADARRLRPGSSVRRSSATADRRARQQRRRREDAARRLHERHRRRLPGLAASSTSSPRCGPRGRRSPRWSSRAQARSSTSASVNAFFHPDGTVIDYGAAKAALLNVAQGALAGARPAGHPHRQRLARTGRDRPWLGEDGVAATIGAATGVAPPRSARAGDRRHPDRPLHDAARGRDARDAARLAADRERQRLELRDRRRARSRRCSAAGAAGFARDRCPPAPCTTSARSPRQARDGERQRARAEVRVDDEVVLACAVDRRRAAQQRARLRPRQGRVARVAAQLEERELRRVPWTTISRPLSRSMPSPPGTVAPAIASSERTGCDRRSA